MNPTKTLWRFFLAHQDSKQEGWLEEQARLGWHLIQPGLFGFTFRQGEPQEANYRLDYQILRSEKRVEYLALFRDAGWEFLGERVNRYYFRARPEALSPEIFSDPESQRDRIRRELRVLGFLLALNGWNTAFLGSKVLREFPWSGGRPILGHVLDWIFPPALVLCAVVTLLLGWCVWQLVRAIRSK